MHTLAYSHGTRQSKQTENYLGSWLLSHNCHSLFPSLAGCPLQLLSLQCSTLRQRLPPPRRVFTLREKEAALGTSLPLNREKEAITSMHARKQPENCLGL